jgi:hypothetical protein
MSIRMMPIVREESQGSVCCLCLTRRVQHHGTDTARLMYARDPSHPRKQGSLHHRLARGHTHPGTRTTRANARQATLALGSALAAISHAAACCPRTRWPPCTALGLSRNCIPLAAFDLGGDSKLPHVCHLNASRSTCQCSDDKYDFVVPVAQQHTFSSQCQRRGKRGQKRAPVSKPKWRASSPEVGLLENIVWLTHCALTCSAQGSRPISPPLQRDKDTICSTELLCLRVQWPRCWAAIPP